MRSQCSLFILGSILIVALMDSTFHGVNGARLNCPPCPGGECPEPENCVHGIVTDFCGRQVCARGPGETCGAGRLASMIGQCGDGLFCRCGRCLGCSLATFECYQKNCL